ncbi:hypothetical protein B5807_07829 [Epicoccum nigrum]|uniref:F-box domain-containing protein n=1 Tax=Epicoccum nigrum TaxID=105696 RepID=A0A1Y2LZW6_EPING|nr:hypothetical protein B5807_07829 [Epicoccum nigrum]
MSAPQSRLDQLPEELLLEILTHINHLPTLIALSKTFTRLHRLTLPRLYYSFPGRNSELFLRTISRSPAFAAHAKTAVWHQERKTRVPLIDVLEKQYILTRLNELAVPHGTDLAAQYAKYGKSDDYWWFEVLLLFLPNLEHVCVCESWLWDDHHYWFKSLSPFFNPLSVSTLKSARLDGPMRIENIVPLLTIDTLRTLELTQVTVMRREGYRVFQWAMWPVDRVLPARSSRLEHLCLRDSYVAPETLAPIMQGIKALRSFTYEHVRNDLADGSVGTSSFTLASHPCLSYQAHSLEAVRIREPSENWFFRIAIVLDRPLDPFRGTDLVDWDKPAYPRLRTADIGPQPVYPSSPGDGSYDRHVRMLAKQIGGVERLRIKLSSDTGGEEHFLPALARAITLYNPSLKTVELVEWDPLQGWYPSDLPTLQRLYGELGLELSSVPGEVGAFYSAEPLFIDEETEADAGWVLITDVNAGVSDP